MKVMKIRRVGNSNVISLPRELERLGYAAGASVVVEELAGGALRIVPADRVRQFIRDAVEQVVAEDQEALSILAEYERQQAVNSDSQTIPA